MVAQLELVRVQLNRGETWPVEEETVIRLERNDASIVKWMCNVMPEDRISAGET